MTASINCVQSFSDSTTPNYTKSKSPYRQWYQSFDTARNTLDVMVSMRMIQKGQIRYVGKDVVKQDQFVQNLLGIAA